MVIRGEKQLKWVKRDGPAKRKAYRKQQRASRRINRRRKKMKRIYLAGSYSADNIIGVLDNIRKGQRAGAVAMMKGYAVFCPWLDYQLHFHLREGETIPKKIYQDNSMAWLEVSNEVWVLPGYENSNGTKREIARAHELKIPVKYLTEQTSPKK